MGPPSRPEPRAYVSFDPRYSLYRGEFRGGTRLHPKSETYSPDPGPASGHKGDDSEPRDPRGESSFPRTEVPSAEEVLEGRLLRGPGPRGGPRPDYDDRSVWPGVGRGRRHRNGDRTGTRNLHGIRAVGRNPSTGGTSFGSRSVVLRSLPPLKKVPMGRVATFRSRTSVRDSDVLDQWGEGC